MPSSPDKTSMPRPITGGQHHNNHLSNLSGSAPGVMVGVPRGVDGGMNPLTGWNMLLILGEQPYFP